MAHIVRVLKFDVWLRAIKTNNEFLIARYIRDGFSLNQCLDDVLVVGGVETPHGYGLDIPNNNPACINIYRDDIESFSLLQIAVQRDVPTMFVNREMVKMLMDAGAEVHSPVLEVAVRQFCVPLMWLLVQRDESMLQELTDDGYNLVHLWACGPRINGLRATDWMYETMLEYLIEANVPMSDPVDSDGNTPLILAAADRSRSMITYMEMIQKKRHPINVNHRNDKGYSALHVLVGCNLVYERDHSDTMQSRGTAMLLLLKHGGDLMLGRGDIDKRTIEDVLDNVPKVRTPFQMLSKSDIPQKELLDPLQFPVEPDIDVLLGVFKGYMQSHVSSR